MKITVSSAGALTIVVLSAVGSSRVLAFQSHRVSAAGPPSTSSAPPPSTAPAKSPQPPPTAPADSKYDRLSGENWEHFEKTLTGSCDNFKYFDPSSNTTVTGPHAIYDDNKKILNAAGDLALDDDKHHVTAAKADVYYGSKKLAILTGNVVIDLKPDKKPDAAQPNAPQQPAPPPADNSADAPSHDMKSERGQGGRITCDHVDDYYKKKFVVLQGHLVFTQQIKKKDHVVTRTMTAEHGEYDGKAEKLHLFGPVQGSDTDGESFKSEKDAYIGTREGEETVTIKGHFETNLLHQNGNDNEDDNGAADAKSALNGTPPPSPDKDKGKQPQR